MHTYVKNDDDSYTIGTWLPNSADDIGGKLVGVTAFDPLFDVATLDEAVRAINILNGGNGAVLDTKIKITKEH